MNYKKCIVLDLDNTLWGGIVGEDGLAGIQLSLTGAGASFIAFQQALLDLYDRGIILAINSRNNPDDALAVIRSHPNMILRERHFAAMRINWQDKAQNILELARELNIGTDAMVFLDDDLTNRAMVRELLPEVETPDLPTDFAEYVRFLLSLDYFPTLASTDEDKMRGNLYVTERLRQQSEKSFSDKEAFLHSLGLELKLHINDPSVLARLAQLTEKTNQFNVNKQPLTEEAVLALIDDPHQLVIHGKLTDRFGDHGLVILAIIRTEQETWTIEQLLMSCRVIGRGVEEAFLSAIVKLAREQAVAKLVINFAPTDKNQPAADFVNKHFNNLTLSTVAWSQPADWINTHYGKI